MIESTEEILEYPMVDRDPLPRWTFGRITLLGDAAHPMYPRGSNGAGQAIIDARFLTGQIKKLGATEQALQHYEAVRDPATAKVVLTNRNDPPDAILREVWQRSGGQRFERIDDVISPAELQAISDRYKKVAGFDREIAQDAAELRLARPAGSPGEIFVLRRQTMEAPGASAKMKPSKSVIALAVTAIAAIAVILLVLNNHQHRLVSATFDPAYPETNANGDPIRAVLEGRIPCSTTDCERLKVQLVLYEHRKKRRPRPIGLGIVGTSGNDRLVTQGTWEIRRRVEGYPEVLVYALDQHADEDVRYFWRVNDNIRLLLDRRMSPKAGNGAWGTMLSRYDAPYGPRTYNFRR